MNLESHRHRRATLLWAAVALAVLAVAAPRLWPADADSFRSTWEAAAAGVERIPLLGMLTVWDGARGTVAPEAAPLLLLARVGGGSHAGASYGTVIVLLAFLWAAGARRIALDLEVGALGSGAFGIVSGLITLSLAGGRISTLAAAPALWLITGALRGGGTLSTVVPILALAALSRPAFLLAVPMTALAALWRAGRDADAGSDLWIPPLVAFLIFLFLPEPDWSHFLRTTAPHYFGGGPYDLAQRSIAGTLVFPFAAGRVGIGGFGVVAGILWIAALLGSARAGERGRGLLAVAITFVLVSLGGGHAHIVNRLGVSGPAVFLVLLVPSLALYPFIDLAGMLAGPCLLALAMKASARTVLQVSLLVIALLPLLTAPPGGARSRPAPDLALGGVKLEARTLALPVAIDNDRRWRQALPASGNLLNGLQEILDRDAPLLARELAAADPRTLRAWLARLRVENVIAPESMAGELGEVVASAGGESLVRLAGAAAEAPPAPCLPSGKWRLRSSAGIPAVSIVERAIDHDLRTRWGSGEPQRPGQFFEIDLSGLHRLSRLDLEVGSFATDYPRGFRVLSTRDGSRWTVVAARAPNLGEVAWNGAFPYYDGGRSGTIRVPLGGVEASAVRIELVSRDQIYDWSIAEVCLHGEPISGEPISGRDGSP